MNHKVVVSLFLCVVISCNLSAMQSLTTGARFLYNHKTAVIGAVGGAAIAYAWWKGYNPLKWWQTRSQKQVMQDVTHTHTTPVVPMVTLASNISTETPSNNVGSSSEQKVLTKATMATEVSTAVQEQSLQKECKYPEAAVLCEALHVRCGANSSAKCLSQYLLQELASWTLHETTFKIQNQGKSKTGTFDMILFIVNKKNQSIITQIPFDKLRDMPFTIPCIPITLTWGVFSKGANHIIGAILSLSAEEVEKVGSISFFLGSYNTSFTVFDKSGKKILWA